MRRRHKLLSRLVWGRPCLNQRSVAPMNVKYAVGNNNSTVERLVVVMRERTTTLESEPKHQMLLHKLTNGSR